MDDLYWLAPPYQVLGITRYCLYGFYHAFQSGLSAILKCMHSQFDENAKHLEDQLNSRDVIIGSERRDNELALEAKDKQRRRDVSAFFSLLIGKDNDIVALVKIILGLHKEIARKDTLLAGRDSRVEDLETQALKTEGETSKLLSKEREMQSTISNLECKLLIHTDSPFAGSAIKDLKTLHMPETEKKELRSAHQKHKTRSLKKDIYHLKSVGERLRVKNVTLTAELNDEQTANAHLQSELSSEQSKNADLEKNLQVLQEALEAEQAKNASLEGNQQKVQEALTSEQAKNAGLEEDIRESGKALKDSQDQGSKLTQLNTLLQNAFQNKKRDAAKLDRRVSALQAIVVNKSRDAAKSQEQINNAIMRITSQQSQVRQMQRIVSTKGHHNRILANCYLDARKQLSNAEKTQSGLEGLLVGLETQLKGDRKAKSKLSATLKKAKARIARLQKKKARGAAVRFIKKAKPPPKGKDHGWEEGDGPDSYDDDDGTGKGHSATAHGTPANSPSFQASPSSGSSPLSRGSGNDASILPPRNTEDASNSNNMSCIDDDGMTASREQIFRQTLSLERDNSPLRGPATSIEGTPVVPSKDDSVRFDGNGGPTRSLGNSSSLPSRGASLPPETAEPTNSDINPRLDDDAIRVAGDHTPTTPPNCHSPSPAQLPAPSNTQKVVCDGIVDADFERNEGNDLSTIASDRSTSTVMMNPGDSFTGSTFTITNTASTSLSEESMYIDPTLIPLPESIEEELEPIDPTLIPLPEIDADELMPSDASQVLSSISFASTATSDKEACRRQDPSVQPPPSCSGETEPVVDNVTSTSDLDDEIPTNDPFATFVPFHDSSTPSEIQDSTWKPEQADSVEYDLLPDGTDGLDEGERADVARQKLEGEDDEEDHDEEAMDTSADLTEANDEYMAEADVEEIQTVLDLGDPGAVATAAPLHIDCNNDAAPVDTEMGDLFTELFGGDDRLDESDSIFNSPNYAPNPEQEPAMEINIGKQQKNDDEMGEAGPLDTTSDIYKARYGAGPVQAPQPSIPPSEPTVKPSSAPITSFHPLSTTVSQAQCGPVPVVQRALVSTYSSTYSMKSAYTHLQAAPPPSSDNHAAAMVPTLEKKNLPKSPIPSSTKPSPAASAQQHKAPPYSPMFLTSRQDASNPTSSTPRQLSRTDPRWTPRQTPPPYAYSIPERLGVGPSALQGLQGHRRGRTHEHHLRLQGSAALSQPVYHGSGLGWFQAFHRLPLHPRLLAQSALKTCVLIARKILPM